MTEWLRDALGLRDGDTPFPWQEELLRRFVDGKIERALDIPTGLGKTAVMAVWLVARACGAKLPRRLVCAVARQAATGYLLIAGSGLEGALRERAESLGRSDEGERDDED